MSKKNPYADLYKVYKEPKYKSITVVYLIRLKDGLLSRKKETFKNIKTSTLNGVNIFKLAELLVKKRVGNNVEYLEIEDVYYSGRYNRKQ